MTKHYAHYSVLVIGNRTAMTTETNYQQADGLVRRIAYNPQLISKGESIDGYPQRRYYFEPRNLKLGEYM